MKIGHPKEFWGGVLFAAIGFTFAIIAYGVKYESSQPVVLVKGDLSQVVAVIEDDAHPLKSLPDCRE